MTRCLSRLLVAVLLVTSVVPVASAQYGNSTLPLTGVVQVLAQKKTGATTYESVRVGSGVIVDTTGTIITNAHVVLDESYHVYDRYIACIALTANSTPQCKHIANLLVADGDYDLALLRLAGQDTDGNKYLPNLSPINWGDSGTLAIGASINILGYPSVGGSTITLTKGTVSGFFYNEKTNPPSMQWIKTDANLNPGNSGGAAVTDNGYLIGIPTFVVQDTTTIGYVRPARFVQNWSTAVLNELNSNQVAPWVLKEIPNDVENFQAHPGNGNVQLTWNPAITTDGIKYYEIVYDAQPIDFSQYGRETDIPHYQTVTDTKLTINGLQNGTTYYFYIVAVSNQMYGSDNWVGTQGTPTLQSSDSPSANNTTFFNDITAQHKNYLAISYLKEQNMISGYQDGTFRPSQLVNRAELAKMLVTTKKQTPDPFQYKNCFSDVHEEWFAVYVCYAKEQGWIAGYPDGSFKPGQQVNRAESIKMIVNAYQLPNWGGVSRFSDVDAQGWYNSYVLAAEQAQILEEESLFTPGRWVSRSEVAENMYRALLIHELGESINDGVWRSPASGVVDVAEYYPLQVGKEWTYVETVANANASVEKKVAVTQTCGGHDGCVVVRNNSNASPQVTNAQMWVHDGTVMVDHVAYSGIPGTNLVSFLQPSMLALANRTRGIYFKYTNPLKFEESTGIITLLDGTITQHLGGFETIQTPDGMKEALKVVEIDLTRITVQANATVIDGWLRDEQTQYYVKGIGLVKGTIRQTVLSSQGSKVVYESSETLKSYK